MSDDWARRTFESIQAAEQKQKHDEELELQRRKQIVSKAPLMWQDLREKIKLKANELNKFFGKGQEYLSISDSTILEVASPKGRLTLDFKPDVPTVVCTYGRTGENAGRAALSFEVKQGEVKWSGFSRDTTPETVEFLLGLIT